MSETRTPEEIERLAQQAKTDPKVSHMDLILPRDQIESNFKEVQDHITSFLEKATGDKFQEDSWIYDKGYGGGRSRVVCGKVIQKGGVNWSGLGNVGGGSAPTSQSATGSTDPRAAFNAGFYATGVSLVIHPKNPHIPTIHMNIRMISKGQGSWWLAGGIDLTPYYPEEKEVIQFHRTLKEICEKHGHDYQKYKKECDDYFTIKHRNEMRGCSGIFFEGLTPENTHQSYEKLWAFVREVGMSFSILYAPFLTSQHQEKPFTPQEEEWQLIRRGRYAEFNLVYDRGTKFGLETGGRIESILMSMPPVANWVYDHKMGEREAKIAERFFQPQDWANM